MVNVKNIEHVIRFAMFAAMIVGVVLSSIQISDLINELKKDQAYFGANGTFSQNLASVDK